MALSGTTTALTVAAAVVWAAFYRGTRPFRRLDASDIVSAKVECLPPDSPDVLNEAQIAELVEFFASRSYTGGMIRIGTTRGRPSSLR